ncbi:exopolysaccharide biosynthesis protein [Paracoccus sp. TOH]|uniref:exopolysaccharide biosynthesis protein n=1 Tax=Paracoccus sp. TOH TaxID=1263728 RepID=UPI0025B04810|nr:exopolysaccharide biosynthesis protein [Paracoccus sp. TOH]WJS86625.1 exopolysaccharide biosynthesis protein [Paracoccus sp. TOH]
MPWPSTPSSSKPPAGPPPAGPSSSGGEGPEPPHKQRLSGFLAAVAGDDTRERISVADLLALLKGRAIAVLLVLFAFPNALPAPPGTSGILGLPLIYLSFQMMADRPPWLPGFIAGRSVARADFASVVARCAPFLAKAERLLSPRLPALTRPVAVRLTGALCLGLSLVLLLPIPLGNMLPGLAICVLALGVLERDGLWIIVGQLLALAGFAVVWGVIWAFLRAFALLLAAPAEAAAPMVI